MSIIDKIESITISRNAIRTKMVSAGQATRNDKLATLASNLNIPNTSDATASASDIALGKTAYVEGEKITGTNTKDADTSDATATAEDILEGKTAYSNGVKLTGTATAGIDTSDATATAGDILSGKTAYVDGAKVAGSITSKAAQTYTPGTTNQTIASGQYLSGTQTIAGDADLIASNIKKDVSIFGVTGTMSSGIECLIDGVEQTEDVSFLSKIIKLSLETNFNYTFDVVNKDNEVYLIGGTSGESQHHFHKTSDFYEFTNIGDFSTRFNHIYCVVYNNEIHLIGLDKNNSKVHYKWNGSGWTSGVSTLPYSPDFRAAVLIFNNDIHMLGGCGTTSYYTAHYKWNGSSWTSVSTLPYQFTNGAGVVYKNAIHILGGTNGTKNHYKWDGSKWSSVSTLPYDFVQGTAIVYNNEIYIIGSSNGTNWKNIYKWNETNWSLVATLEKSMQGSKPVVLNNKLYIIGGTSIPNSFVIYDSEKDELQYGELLYLKL